jgi:iron complex transport system ATP-binding protein
MITVSGLSYSIGEKPILQEIDFSVRENDFILIFGRNGAGKSTLLKALAGIVPAQKGFVAIQGKNTHDYSRRELATMLSYLPQFDEFVLPMLVKDILLSGRYPYRSLFQKFSHCDHAKFQEAVEYFSLAELVNRNILTLSGGERQKVMLATALIQDVPIILLDEPMNFLDPASIFQMIKMLRGLHGMGKTILLVSHLIEYFFPYVNKLLALESGKKYYFGDKKFSPDLFKAIYQVEYKRFFVENREILFVNE